MIFAFRSMAATLLLVASLGPASVWASGPIIVAFNMQSPRSGDRLVQNFKRDRHNSRRRNNDWIPMRISPDKTNRENAEQWRERQRHIRQKEQDAARDAVRRGEVLALDGIIRSVSDYCPGTFLDASLQRRGDGIFYRVTILRPSGRRVVLGVDARTGAVVSGRCR